MAEVPGTAAGDEGTPPCLDRPSAGLATITLNRPRHLNRLHREDLEVLQEQLAELAADRTLRVLVLQATGRHFCAGFNLQELAQPGAGREDPQRFERTVDALAALPVPSLARLQGGVFGGATDLALACDFRVGVPATVLRMPAARIGLHYYPNGLERYVSRLGLQAAKRLFLLAETVPAEELQRIGFLDRLVADDALDAEVQRLVEALMAGAPLAVNGMKRSLDEIATGRAEAGVLAARVQACAESADLRERSARVAAGERL